MICYFLGDKFSSPEDGFDEVAKEVKRMMTIFFLKKKIGKGRMERIIKFYIM
jgi:hypothetical protein